jgi:hypothetical protein
MGQSRGSRPIVSFTGDDFVPDNTPSVLLVGVTSGGK